MVARILYLVNIAQQIVLLDTHINHLDTALLKIVQSHSKPNALNVSLASMLYTVQQEILRYVRQQIARQLTKQVCNAWHAKKAINLQQKVHASLPIVKFSQIKINVPAVNKISCSIEGTALLKIACLSISKINNAPNASLHMNH